MRKIVLYAKALKMLGPAMAAGMKQEVRMAFEGQRIDEWYEVRDVAEKVRLHFTWVQPMTGLMYGTMHVGSNFQFPLRDVDPGEITSLIASFHLDPMKLMAA